MQIQREYIIKIYSNQLFISYNSQQYYQAELSQVQDARETHPPRCGLSEETCHCVCVIPAMKSHNKWIPGCKLYYERKTTALFLLKDQPVLHKFLDLQIYGHKQHRLLPLPKPIQYYLQSIVYLEYRNIQNFTSRKQKII